MNNQPSIIKKKNLKTKDNDEIKTDTKLKLHLYVNELIKQTAGKSDGHKEKNKTKNKVL